MAERITVLDDDPEVCKTITTVLTLAGYDVEFYYHTDEAWRAILKRRPGLLLVNTELPDVHGWEFIRRIRADERVRTLPILVLARRLSVLDRMSAKLFDILGFVMKPFKHAQLLTAVESALLAATAR